MKTLIYLAVPYSHPDPAVRQQRFEEVNRHAAHFMRLGDHIFSPISHTHPIALTGDLPLGFDFWQQYDEAVLACCKAMYVLQLEGWTESKGVQAEIAIAERLGIPVTYIHPSMSAPINRYECHE